MQRNTHVSSQDNLKKKKKLSSVIKNNRKKYKTFIHTTFVKKKIKIQYKNYQYQILKSNQNY